MKKIKLKNKKLVKILKERSLVLTNAKKLQKQVEKLQKDQQKLGVKMDRLKDKTKPIVDKEKEKLDLSEFEYIARVFLEEDTPYLEIKDQVQDYIEMLKEKKDEKKNN